MVSYYVKWYLMDSLVYQDPGYFLLQMWMVLSFREKYGITTQIIIILGYFTIKCLCLYFTTEFEACNTAGCTVGSVNVETLSIIAYNVYHQLQDTIHVVIPEKW